MSKDEAMGRLIRIAEKCNERSIVRLCDELEDMIEAGPYGVYELGASVAITAGATDDSSTDPALAVRESALLLAASGL